MAKILIMAGGTGGHIFPALPVAEILRQHGHEIFWMGTRHGLETKLLPEAALYTIDFAGVRKKGLKMLFTTPMALLRAIAQASKAFKASSQTWCSAWEDIQRCQEVLPLFYMAFPWSSTSKTVSPA